jgi:hypothetical protein
VLWPPGDCDSRAGGTAARDQSGAKSASARDDWRMGFLMAGHNRYSPRHAARISERKLVFLIGSGQLINTAADHWSDN